MANGFFYGLRATAARLPGCPTMGAPAYTFVSEIVQGMPTPMLYALANEP